MNSYKARFAGSWYSSEKSELESEIKSHINEASIKEKLSDVKGIIVPHAGYAYSGPAAGYSIKAIQNEKPDSIIILSPSHRAYLNKISIMNFDEIETPLGKVEIDTSINEELLKQKELFIDNPKSYINEHAFELMIPWVQYVIKSKFKVNVLVVGDLSLSEYIEAKNVIEKITSNKKVLFVASSDFTHFGASFDYLPFNDNIKDNLYQLDMKAGKLISELKIKEFEDYLNVTGATICGRNPILLLMNLMNGKKGKILNYITSGDMTGDYSHSVSYMSVVF